MIQAKSGQSTQRPILKLLTGESSLIPPDAQASMLVGSCLGLFMFDPDTKTSAAAHVALPRTLRSGAQGKYADAAPGYLLSLLRSAGCPTNRIVVKLAGAACMYGSPTHDTVGDMNLAVINRTMQTLGVSPRATHVRGQEARQLLFDSRDGSLRVTLVAGETVEI